jgi:hypothetical protein
VECNENNGGNGKKKYLLIIKKIKKGELLKKMVSEKKSFEKEMKMYRSKMKDM